MLSTCPYKESNSKTEWQEERKLLPACPTLTLGVSPHPTCGGRPLASPSTLGIVLHVDSEPVVLSSGCAASWAVQGCTCLINTVLDARLLAFW